MAKFIFDVTYWVSYNLTRPYRKQILSNICYKFCRQKKALFEANSVIFNTVNIDSKYITKYIYHITKSADITWEQIVRQIIFLFCKTCWQFNSKLMATTKIKADLMFNLVFAANCLSNLHRFLLSKHKLVTNWYR